MTDAYTYSAQELSGDKKPVSEETQLQQEATLAAYNDVVLPLAAEVVAELKRTGFPVEHHPGVFAWKIIVDNESVLAWKLSSPRIAFQMTGQDHILEDGRLIRYRRVQTGTSPVLNTREHFEHLQRDPLEEITQGHQVGDDMSKRPEQFRVGLQHLLDALRELPAAHGRRVLAG